MLDYNMAVVPKHTHIHTTYCRCVCVCVCLPASGVYILVPLSVNVTECSFERISDKEMMSYNFFPPVKIVLSALCKFKIVSTTVQLVAK